MKKTTTLTFLLAFTFFSGIAQDYLMNSSLTNLNVCEGFFMDSGGGNGKYSSNQDFTTTICPDGVGGTHTQLIFSPPDLGFGDDLCFFDGVNTNAPSLGCASDFNNGASFIIQATASNNSGCVTVDFNSNFIFNGDGWSADINCISACQTIQSVLVSTDPAVVPVDTGWIDICPGERVFFQGEGLYPQNNDMYFQSDATSEFVWDFGDGNSSVGPDASHVFTEPGGYIVELTITDQIGCKNTNFIKQRVRVAPKPHFELGVWDEQVCSGDTVNLSAMVNSSDDLHTVSVMPGEETFQTGGIRSDSLPLPDGDGASYSTTISFAGFAPGQTLEDINDLMGIFVNMEHSWMRDLEISIECPDGTSVMLHHHPGQMGGEVFLGEPYENDEGNLNPVPGVGYTYGWAPNPDYNQTWIDYANLNTPATLPAGTYKSYQPLENLVGCPLNGDWMITVTDLWSIDNGNIFSWSIDFASDLYPALETFSPELVNWEWYDHPTVFHENADSISAAPVNAGEVAYTFAVEDEFGCVWDTTVNIEVLPYTHPDCHSCSSLLGNFPDSSICYGDSLLLDVSTSLSSGAVTFESYDNYGIGASNHSAATPFISTINVNSIVPLQITDPTMDIVSVCLDFETDTDGDISLYLVAPSGIEMPLSTNNGGAGANFTQTCFTPTATQPITAGVAPFTGAFLPEGNWINILGENINGDWSLKIIDANDPTQMGLLKSWSITFQTENEVTYEWQPSTALSCLDCPTPMAAPLADEIFSVTASDIYGCSASDDIEIAVQIDYFAPDVQLTEFPGGIVEVTWNDANPSNPDYEVNVNGTGWIPSNNGNFSHMINGLQFGNIINVQVRSIILTAACAVGLGNASITYGFCTLNGSIDTQGTIEVSCNGLCDASVQLSVADGTAPYNYQVTNVNTGAIFNQDNGDIEDLCFGNYQVIISDVNDCRDTLDFEVLNKNPIIVSANETSPVSCFGGSDGCAEVQASGGAGGFTFVWNDPNMSIGDMVCGLSAGSAIVTATDLDGCIGSGAANITEPDELTLTIDHTDVNCLGGNDGTATANVNGGVEPYTFLWSGGDTPDEASTGGLIAGNYNLIVTDANGCSITGSVQIDQPTDGLSLTLTPFSGCNGLNQNRVESQVTGGSPPYIYTWTPNVSTGPDITDLPNGNYTLLVTDDAGCTITESVLVQDLPAISIDLATSSPTCHDDNDGAIAANIVTGGTGMGYTFQWSTNPNDNDDFIQGLMGGLTYTVTVSDSQGCTGEAGVDMPNPAPPSPEATVSDVSCFGLVDGEIEITNVANANAPISYQWDAAANNQTGPTATGLMAGDYSVMVEDGDGCTATAIYSIQEPAAIVADFNVIDNDCFGGSDGSIDPSVSGGNPSYLFVWSNGSTAAKLTDVASDLYYVTITDANNCAHEDSVFVGQPMLVTINPIPEDVSCFGDRDGSVTIEADGGTPPYHYSIDNQMYVGSNILIALEAGDYPVYVRDANDCIYNSNVTIGEPDELQVSIIGNGIDNDEITIMSGDDLSLDADINNAVGNVTYEWSAAWCGTLSCPGDTLTDCDTVMICSNPIANPDFTNDYYLTIIDENGCEAEDNLQVHVKKIRLVEVPTGFTPNGDNVNEMLLVHGRSGTMIKTFQVFDRWGELLFQDNDLPINDNTRGWDGTFKNTEMPAGVYVWYIEAEYADGMTETFKGETTLIR